MRAFGVSGCAGWIWPRFDAPRSARARSRDAPGRAPSAGIEPLGSRLAHKARSRHQIPLYGDFDDNHSDDDDCNGSASMDMMAGRTGSNPVRPKLIEAMQPHMGTSASVEMPPSSTHTAPGRRRTHERCVPRFGRRYERRLAMCGAMRASPNKS